MSTRKLHLPVIKILEKIQVIKFRGFYKQKRQRKMLHNWMDGRKRALHDPGEMLQKVSCEQSFT